MRRTQKQCDGEPCTPLTSAVPSLAGGATAELTAASTSSCISAVSAAMGASKCVPGVGSEGCGEASAWPLPIAHSARDPSRGGSGNPGVIAHPLHIFGSSPAPPRGALSLFKPRSSQKSLIGCFIAHSRSPTCAAQRHGGYFQYAREEKAQGTMVQWSMLRTGCGS